MFHTEFFLCSAYDNSKDKAVTFEIYGLDTQDARHLRYMGRRRLNGYLAQRLPTLFLAKIIRCVFKLWSSERHVSLED